MSSVSKKPRWSSEEIKRNLEDYIESAKRAQERRDAEVKAVLGFKPRISRTIPSMGGSHKKRKP